MMRLKAIKGAAAAIPVAIFQFLYGTIKGQSLSLNPGQVDLFQFLDGMIKGLATPLERVFIMKFQFLYGTIKGWHSTASVWAKTNFNS